MEAYVYQAALYCEECGAKIRAELDASGKRPEDPEDEPSYDSDDYPKGPYPDGGGEADTPQHCDACFAFLENPLTSEGYAYTCEAVLDCAQEILRGEDAARERPSWQEWRPFYSINVAMVARTSEDDTEASIEVK